MNWINLLSYCANMKYDNNENISSNSVKKAATELDGFIDSNRTLSTTGAVSRQSMHTRLAVDENLGLSPSPSVHDKKVDSTRSRGVRLFTKRNYSEKIESRTNADNTTLFSDQSRSLQQNKKSHSGESREESFMFLSDLENKGGTVDSKTTVLSKALSTPRHNLVKPSSSVVKMHVPEIKATDKILNLEKVLGYSGGPAVLLYNGELLIISTGPLLILIDLNREVPGASSFDDRCGLDDSMISKLNSPPSKSVSRSLPVQVAATGNSRCHGLWRAFKDSFRERNCVGFRQAILRGHTGSIGFIEVLFSLVIQTQF